MKPLLYFLSGAASAQRVVGAIPYAFAKSQNGRQCAGPDGSQGIVCAESSDATFVMVKRDEQTWMPYPGNDKLWFGWWNDSLPTPASLSVEKPLPGHSIPLAGQNWTIPLAKRLHESASSASGFPKIAETLPRRLVWDGSEFQTGDIVPRYRALWELSEQIFDAWRAQADGMIKLPANSELLCCQLLAINYRVSPAEICGLGLLDDDPNQMWEILSLVIDVPTIHAWSKKKVADAGESTLPGVEV